MSGSDLVYVHLLRGNPLAGGATFGEVTEHMYARAGFVDELGRHERVLALFEAWALDSGLHERLERAVAALDEIARSRDCADRGELIPQIRLAEQALAVLGWEVAEFVFEFQQRFDEVMGADQWRHRMRRDAADLAAYFEVDWCWIPLEALALFESKLYMRLWNLDTFRACYVPSAPWTPAPDIDLHLVPRAGESAFEFASRCAAWSQREVERLQAIAPEPLPRGETIPRKARTDRYHRWGSWSARHHVHRESIRQLSMREFDNEDRRRDIRSGIRRADEMLSRLPLT